MKRKLLFMVCLIAVGALSYYGGYRIYTTTHPKTEILDVERVQKNALILNQTEQYSEEYYIGKIEQDMLVIYKMPEETVYDSVEISGLHFYGSEEAELMAGKLFENLTEVFEFLENSMS